MDRVKNLHFRLVEGNWYKRQAQESFGRCNALYSELNCTPNYLTKGWAKKNVKIWTLRFISPIVLFISIVLPYFVPSTLGFDFRTLFEPSNIQNVTKFDPFFRNSIFWPFRFGTRQKISNFWCKIVDSYASSYENWILSLYCHWKNLLIGF